VANSPWDPSQAMLGPTEQSIQIFSGTVISRKTTSTSLSIEVTAYDPLRTLLKNDVDVAIESGTPFREALSKLADGWGMDVGRVDGPDVDLGEHTWRGEQAGKVLADMLEEALAGGGGHFTLRASGDALEVIAPGTNDPVYELATGKGAGETSVDHSIADLVDKVKVYGEAEEAESQAPTTNGEDEQEDQPPEDETATPEPAPPAETGKKPPTRLVTEVATDAGFNGATKIVTANNAPSAERAELEAKAALAKDGFPSWRYEHNTLDLPMVRKWDAISIKDSILDGRMLVTDVSHEPSSGSMRLILETPEDFERKAQQAVLEGQLKKLRGEEEAAQRAAQSAATAAAPGGMSVPGGAGVGGAGGVGGAALIRQIVEPILGRKYAYGGPLGRSNFDPRPAAGISTDCSGAVAWLYHQLGCPGLPAQTMAIKAHGLQQVGSSLEAAAVGDLLLYAVRDPGNPGQPYGHVACYVGNGEVFESGGNKGGVGWGVGIKSPFLVLRSACVQARLRGSAG
jgi:cell wall-associated NlpC family hydrolase